MSKHNTSHNDKDRKKSSGIIDKIVKAVFGGGMADKAGKKLSGRAKKLRDAEKRAGL